LGKHFVLLHLGQHFFQNDSTTHSGFQIRDRCGKAQIGPIKQWHFLMSILEKKMGETRKEVEEEYG